MPQSRSRSAIMRLTPDCVYESERAARVKLPVRTVSTNAWYFWMLASTDPPSCNGEKAGFVAADL